MIVRAVVLAFALVFACPRVALGDSLNIDGAVRLALQNNERAQKAPLRVDIAESQVERARDAFFPTLSAQGTGTYHPVPRGNDTTTNGSVTMTQPLVNPSSWPQYAQQVHNLDSEKWGAVQDLRQLAFDTAKAFVQTLTAESVLSAAQRKVDSAKTNLEMSKVRAQAGLNSTNDVTKAQLQLASSQGQLVSAQGNVERTYLSLSFIVGQPVQGPLVPPDKTTNAAHHFEQVPTNQVKNALDRRQKVIAAAQARRPDVLSLHAKNEGLADSAAEPLYRLIPSLNASGQVRFVPDALPSEKSVDEQASLNLSWQIFDAGLRYADRKQRVAQLESSKLDEHLLRRSVETDVELALAALHAARGNYDSAAAAATASQQNTTETAVLYQQGLATALDMTDANDKQFEAEVTLDAAKLAMEQAYFDLRSALGFGPIDDGKGTAP